MKNPNVLLLSMDEVRVDDLSCYGQEKIETPSMDSWAEDGVLFEETRAAAPWTPVAMGTMMCGAYPNKHGRRHADTMWTPLMTLAEIMKNNGYKTAGWSGAGLLTTKYGLADGFDEFSDPSLVHGMRPFYPQYDKLSDEEFVDKVILELAEVGVEPRERARNWWIDDVISWLEENKDEQFFIWLHLMETHTGNPSFYLHHGVMEKGGVYAENEYMLGHAFMGDKYFIKPILETTEKLGLDDNTVMILASDHGAMCQGRKGERPQPDNQFHRGSIYPWHTTLYDPDIHVVNIWKGPGLPKGVRVKGQVRTIDFVPTILDLCSIEPPKEAELDGVSLLPFIKTGKAEGLVAYIEHMAEWRQYGCQQALCVGRYKFIRSLTTGAEELYDLEWDPEEKVNLLHSSIVPFGERRESTIPKLEETPSAGLLVEWRRILNTYMLDLPTRARHVKGRTIPPVTFPPRWKWPEYHP